MNISSTHILSAEDSRQAKSLFNILLGGKFLTKYTLRVQEGIHHFSLDFDPKTPADRLENLRKFIRENVDFLLIEEK